MPTSSLPDSINTSRRCCLSADCWRSSTQRSYGLGAKVLGGSTGAGPGPGPGPLSRVQHCFPLQLHGQAQGQRVFGVDGIVEVSESE